MSKVKIMTRPNMVRKKHLMGIVKVMCSKVRVRDSLSYEGILVDSSPPSRIILLIINPYNSVG